ncbi:MAG: hypothetical protein ACE5JM_12785, partial [Armatimonadota bacterium]
MKRSAAIVVCVAVATSLAVLAALPGLSAASVKALLPTSKTVPGWEPVEKTYEYCANPEKLYLIYNGGDVEYIESGVQEAVQQAYKKGNSLVIVTVHRLPDWQKAKAFYQDKHDRMKKARKLTKFTDLKVDKAGFMAVQYGTCHGWSWGKHYLMGFATKGATEADQAALKTFMASIEKAIQKS